jgi:LAO/AO transport system kinase
VQAIKAGILEIADILVVNKVDRPGAANTVRNLRMMLELGHPGSRSQVVAHHGQLLHIPSNGKDDENVWVPPIIQTVASDGKGIDELIAAIEQHRQHLASGGVLAQLERQQIEIELYNRLRDALMAHLLQNVPGEVFADVIGRIQARELDPQRAVQAVLASTPNT